MKKLLIILLILYANIPCFASTETPIVIKFQEITDEVKSGGIFTMYVEVASRERLPEKLSTSLILPMGWEVIDRRNPKKTSGLTWVKYAVAISIPDYVPEGQYRVGFKVEASGVERKVTNQTIEVINAKSYERIFGVSSLKKAEKDTLKEVDKKIIEKISVKEVMENNSKENTSNDIIIANDSLPNTYSINFKGASLKIVPGKPFTIFVEVISDKNIQDNVEPVLALPDGWNILIKKAPEKTRGINVLRYMYTLTLPSLTPSGTYNIVLRVLINNQEVAKNTKRVEVIRVRGIEITPLNTPEYVKEGDTLTMCSPKDI